MRVIVEVESRAVIPRLRRYGRVLSVFRFADAVGMEVEDGKVEEIRALEGVESVRPSQKVGVLQG